MKINKTDKIFVSGHTGLVGSGIVRELKKKGYKKIITATRKKLDLVDQKKVFNFLKKKNQNLFLLQLQKLGVFIIMTLKERTLFTKT